MSNVFNVEKNSNDELWIICIVCQKRIPLSSFNIDVYNYHARTACGYAARKARI